MEKTRERKRAKKKERERERGEEKKKRGGMRRWQGESLSYCAIEKFPHIEGSADVCTRLWQQLVHKRVGLIAAGCGLSYFVLVTHPTIALWYLYRRTARHINIFASKSIMYAVIGNWFVYAGIIIFKLNGRVAIDSSEITRKFVAQIAKCIVS